MYSEALAALPGSESGRGSTEEPPSWMSLTVTMRKRSSATRRPAEVSSAMAAAAAADWTGGSRGGHRRGGGRKQPETLPVTFFQNKEQDAEN